MLSDLRPVSESQALRDAFDLYRTGKLAHAEMSCLKIVEQFPHSPAALHLLGVLYFTSGRHDAAIEAISQSLSVNSTDSTAFNNLGEAYRALGRLDDAARCYRQALMLNDSYGDAYCNLGIVFKDLGRFDDSEAALNHALRLNPDNVMARGNLGLVFEQTGRLAEAEQTFGRAIMTSPDSAELHMHLARLLTETGKLHDAECSYRNALLLLPDSAEIYNNLGLLLNRLGRIDEALQACDAAIRIKPEYVVAHNNRGIILRNAGQLDASDNAFRTSITINPNYVEGYCNLGIVLKERGLLYEAVEIFEKALLITSECAEIHCHYAGALHQLGRVTEAKETYRHALRLKPDYPEAMSNLGSLLIHINQLTEATELFDRVVNLQPDNVMVHHVYMALTGNTPRRAPEQYVVQLFNGYADTFDYHLQNKLQYKTPKELFELVSGNILGKRHDILDLGCGTGLIGELAVSIANRLTGVDLSPRMLEKARQKNIYHQLIESDLLLMMKSEDTGSYDIIFAADVFIYVGELDDIISEAMRLLRPGGLMAFSVESLDAVYSTSEKSSSRAFKLMQSARYSHSKDYLLNLAVANNCVIESLTSSDIRLESGTSIVAYNVLFRKADDLVHNTLDHAFQETAHLHEGCERLQSNQITMTPARLVDKTVLLYAPQDMSVLVRSARYIKVLHQYVRKIYLAAEQPESIRSLFEYSFARLQVVSCEAAHSTDFEFACDLEKLPDLYQNIPPDAACQLSIPYLKARENSTYPEGKCRVGLALYGADADETMSSATIVQALPLHKRHTTTFVFFPAALHENGAIPVFFDYCDTSDVRDYADIAEALSGVDIVVGFENDVTHLAGALGKPVLLMKPALQRDSAVRFVEDYPLSSVFFKKADEPWSQVFKNIFLYQTLKPDEPLFAPFNLNSISLAGISQESLLQIPGKEIENTCQLHELFDLDLADVTSVTIETTTVCNLRCSYCPHSTEFAKKPVFMPDEIFYRIIDSLHEFRPGYCGQIIPSMYGEPLLDNRLERLVSYARQKFPHASIDLFTNGSFLTVERYLALKQAGITKFNVSIHTPEISEALIQTLTTIEQEFSDRESFTLLNTYRNNKLNRGGLIQVEPPEREICCRMLRCSSGFQNLVFDNQGNAILCCNDYLSQIQFGTITTESVDQIWNKPAYRRTRNELLFGFLSRDMCRTCLHHY